MQSEWLNLLSNFISAIIGGSLSLLGTIVVQKVQIKKEKTLWKNERRLDLYVDLISLLNSIEIRVQPIYDESLSVVEMKTEVEYLKNKLSELLNFMRINKGKLLLFLPKGVNSKLVKLSSAIYAITANEEKQNIDISNYKESEIFKVVQDAITISVELNKEFEK